MRAERRAHLVILGSRGLSEAVAYATLAAMLHASTTGREPVALVATSAAVFGMTLVLASILRERGTVRQGAALTALVMGGSAAWALTLPARPPDALAVLSRIVGFGVLGEIYLWRLLGVARGLQRWHEVRSDGLFALIAVGITALVPGPIDRDALPVLGLVVAVAGAVALSLARSVEELELSGQQTRGRPAGSAATGTAFALGLLAIALALLLPFAQAALGAFARTVGPILDDALVAILLPVGYVAALVVAIAVWLRDLIGLRSFPQIQMPTAPMSDEELRQRLLEMDQTRPIVFGAIEVVVAIVALAVAVFLIVRLAEERRALLTEGVSLVREAVDGIGLRATLGTLLPRRAPKGQPPRDDATAATRLRRVYWRLLDVAERDGPGRRGPAETPAEHERRLVRAGERWRAASEVVRAFEDLRYGEREPDGATVERAAAALARVETAG